MGRGEGLINVRHANKQDTPTIQFRNYCYSGCGSSLDSEPLGPA